jgi:hypothetical protein
VEHYDSNITEDYARTAIEAEKDAVKEMGKFQYQEIGEKNLQIIRSNNLKWRCRSFNYL